MKGEVIEFENLGRNDRKHLPQIKENLSLLPKKTVEESFEDRQARLEGKRIKYAGMIAHQELAAVALASGMSYKMAAAKAGVSVRQVKKYYTESDFRARIEELRTVMFSKIRGRVIKELSTRTGPDQIGNIELLDLLRVFDRVAGPIGGKMGINVAGDVNVTNSYDSIINALLLAERGGEGTDFPIYRPEDLQLSGEGSPE